MGQGFTRYHESYGEQMARVRKAEEISAKRKAAYRAKKLAEVKKCDMCGEEFTGETYKVYNENNALQKGLVSCGCHMDVPDAEEQHT
jgi:ribosomal protein L37AE/L43A